MKKYKIFGQQGINDEVITHYIDIISNGIKRKEKNSKIVRVQSHKEIKKGDTCIFYTFPDAIRILIRKKVNYYIWFQGIYPEERQLYSKGKFDYLLCSFLEKIVIKKAKKIFVVSDEMISFYEKKYKIKIREKSLIIPCYNDKINEEAFKVNKKYLNPTFAYVGSLSKWQCFDKIVELYKKINEIIPSSKLYVYTKSVDEAKKILDSNNVYNYCVECIKPEEVNTKLANIKYGFIIRDNIAVNNVATPTKFVNYLSAGVIPIISKCIKSYDRIAKESKYIISEKNDNDIIEQIKEIESKKVSVDDIYNSYYEIFDKYFNDNKNEKRVSIFLKDK